MRNALGHLRSLFVKTSPVHLTFFVTRRCNARCPFCFYEKEREGGEGEPELSIDEVRRIARSMGRLLWVLFSGGEPFLRQDLAGIAQAFHDANRALFLTLPTNGLLPETIEETTEEVLRRCPESVVAVKLSIDGVGEDHDAIRGTPGGFAKVLRSYERLAALARRHPRLELGVNTLFCSKNQERMDGIIDFVAGLEALRAHTITMARAGAGGGDFTDVDLGRYRSATLHLEERWRDRFHRFAGARFKAAQDRVQREVIHDTLLAKRRLIPCYAGRLGLVLSESGELWACEGRREESLGNVRGSGHDVREVLRSGRARRIVEDVAGGGCHCSHECNLLVNLLFNPRMQPRLVGEWARMKLGISRTSDRAVGSIAPAFAGECEPRDGRQCA